MCHIVRDSKTSYDKERFRLSRKISNEAKKNIVAKIKHHSSPFTYFNQSKTNKNSIGAQKKGHQSSFSIINTINCNALLRAYCQQ
jgi:hypothetical protein